jgi:hypothetical protein
VLHACHAQTVLQCTLMPQRVLLVLYFIHSWQQQLQEANVFGVKGGGCSIRSLPGHLLGR